MTQGPKREPIKIPVNAVGCQDRARPGKPYFVEFRSRTAVSYGHTFVFYGRLGDGNRFASYQVAGLHPKGDDPNIYHAGHDGAGAVRNRRVLGRSRRAISDGAFLRDAERGRISQDAGLSSSICKATKKTWHATTYNCNAFAADIARQIGLDTPNPNMYLPESFIKRMADTIRAASRRARSP